MGCALLCEILLAGVRFRVGCFHCRVLGPYLDAQPREIPKELIDMKCPACKKRLKLINPAQPGEFICDNEKCPANTEHFIYYEFYGTQDEINTQWPKTGKG